MSCAPHRAISLCSPPSCRGARRAVRRPRNNVNRKGGNAMKLSTIVGVALAGSAGLVLAQALKGPVNDAPFTEKWWPSKWGADDKAGSANHTKDSNNIKRALATVKQYKSITVGKYYHREIPAFGP